MKVKDADPKTMLMLANIYVSNELITFEQIGRDYGLTRTMVSNIIWRGIAESIIPSTTADAVYAKLINSCNVSSTNRLVEHWDEAFQKRESVRENIRKKLETCRKIIAISNRYLNNYEQYKASTDTPFSQAELSEKLEKATRYEKYYLAALS